VLFDVSLEVEAGEVAVLLGRNGQASRPRSRASWGWSRRCAARSGWTAASWPGCPPYRISRAGVGYVPEDRRVFAELTVTENLEVGRQPPREGAPAWTPEGLFRIFPNLAAMRDRPGGRMSGGEQQMLTIARTLMGNPRLLLLDEPSEGLAPVIVAQMADAVRALKAAGVAVLLSEQNVRFAAGVATGPTCWSAARSASPAAWPRSRRIRACGRLTSASDPDIFMRVCEKTHRSGPALPARRSR
jgi:branched-chain amino acid transport system ATP-binding protein